MHGSRTDGSPREKIGKILSFEDARTKRWCNQMLIDRIQGVPALPGNLDAEHSAQNPNVYLDPDGGTVLRPSA